MADMQSSWGRDSVAEISAVDLADWRLRTFALYDTVRRIAADNPAEAHSYWRQERDRIFRTHPASALTAEDKAVFSGLRTADYEPIYRFNVRLTTEGAGRELTVDTGTDGMVRFVRLGTFDLPEMGQLAVWRINGYGGGIFVPSATPPQGGRAAVMARAVIFWTPSRAPTMASKALARMLNSSWTSTSLTTLPAPTTRRGLARFPVPPTAWPWKSRSANSFSPGGQ